MFAHLDPAPFGAASIAQVHRARIHSSSEVVEKICRSSIGETIAADLRLLARLTTLAETELLQLRPYRLQPMVCESARSL